MPSRAPTYYHWAQDRPCTTNQVYGYYMKGYVDEVSQLPAKPKGPFDYTRPFSNAGFFPQITDDDSGMISRKKDGGLASLSKTHRNRFEQRVSCKCPKTTNQPKKHDINEGYRCGFEPVTRKIVHSSVPSGVFTKRAVSAPTTSYNAPEPHNKSTYLWHSLSGSLVHVKNKPQIDSH